MKSVKVLILLALASAVYCGGPSPCEPFVSNFQPFLQAWLNIIDQFKNLAIDFSSVNPIFKPALLESLKCRTSVAINFAENSISRMSGVNKQEVVSILNGTMPAEPGTPLDCIAEDILYIQQHILSIYTDVVPLLENSVESETTPNDCSEVTARLNPYTEVGIAVSIRLRDILRHNRQVFSSLGLEDLYIKNLESLIPCLLKVIGIGLGSLLNADGSAVTQYLSGEIPVLPYPFSCTENGLSFIKNNFFKDFSDLYYGNRDSFDFNFPK